MEMATGYRVAVATTVGGLIVAAALNAIRIAPAVRTGNILIEAAPFGVVRMAAPRYRRISVMLNCVTSVTVRTDRSRRGGRCALLPKLLARGVLDRDVTLVAIEDRQDALVPNEMCYLAGLAASHNSGPCHRPLDRGTA